MQQGVLSCPSYFLPVSPGTSILAFTKPCNFLQMLPYPEETYCLLNRSPGYSMGREAAFCQCCTGLSCSSIESFIDYFLFCIGVLLFWIGCAAAFVLLLYLLASISPPSVFINIDLLLLLFLILIRYFIFCFFSHLTVRAEKNRIKMLLLQ